MKHADHNDRRKRERRRTARRRQVLQDDGSSERRWVAGKDVHLADEVRYIQCRAAKQDTP